PPSSDPRPATAPPTRSAEPTRWRCHRGVRILPREAPPAEAAQARARRARGAPADQSPREMRPRPELRRALPADAFLHLADERIQGHAHEGRFFLGWHGEGPAPMIK